MDLAVRDPHGPLEDAADDALLSPDLPLPKFAVRVEAGQLGARARAARRAVVGLARAEHEILAVHAVEFGRREEFDVVYLLAARARDARTRERLPDTPSEFGQRLEVLKIELLAVFADEKK